ncbi:MAG TPA: TonB-dependent receptor [Steroidobacteraceae bacterium]|jgi:outer membrane receptor protein involved in Fe transport|nr:TonB-dependent receptor [Steroidobacteraceae bacterium]
MSSHRNRGVSRATALLCGFSVVAVSSLSIAQEKNEDDKALQEVVVTGSRIIRAGYDTLEPASVVTGEYIQSRGLTNIADALNESPGFGTGVTPEGGQSTFGPGLNFVNRFGLGSNRTLTLINGRRFVSSNAPSIFGPAAPGSQVDLNFIPTILVDTIDNLAVGGAPTYGADAIAGVVNVKLKKNFEGIQAFAQYGQLEDGGLQSDSIGLVGGWNFAADRGNVTASIQHSSVDGLLATENSRFADAYLFATNPSTGTGTLTPDDDIALTQPARRPGTDGRVNGGVPFNVNSADGIPNAVLIRNRRIFGLNFGGVALPTGTNTLADGRLRCFGATTTVQGSCLQFSPDGNLVPYNPGVNFGTTDASGGDGLYLVETLQLVSDLKRTSATVSTHFDVTDNVQLFADVFAYKADAEEIVDQTAYNATIFGASSAAITLPANHPGLTQQARDTLAGLGQTTFRISRAHRDLAENNARSESDLYQGVVGASGDFEAANRRYNWEVYFNYGNNKATFFSTQLNRQRFVNALNVVSVGGQLACSPTPGYTALPGGRVVVGTDVPVADPNCVPLDIFGEGRPSAAAIAYVSSIQKTDFELTQEVFNANIGSQLFDIWGGPIEYNVGVERRKESGDFAPDAYLQAGLGRSAAIQPLKGSYATKEFFGELIIPLISKKNEIPFVNELTITGKGRRVDNEVNGKFSAWTGGLQWAPFEDLEFRGNLTRSLRAPSLTELFTPVSPLFTTVADPCSTSNYGAIHPRTATRQANCQQFFQEFGLPTNGTWQSNAVTATVQGTSQGDTGLANESANAWTVGFVARPRWVPGLELAVDWVDIRIDDAITNLTATDLAQACFDNFEYPNDYCNRFTRNPVSAGPTNSGQITFVQTGFANGAYQSMAGVTLEGRYRHEFEKVGTFEVGVSYYRLRDELRSATGIVTTNSEEQLGSPTDSVQLNLIYERGPFGARWQTNYVGAQLYGRTFGVESRDVLEVNSDYTHNLSVFYQPTDSATVRLAVTNILDGKPPFPIGGDAFNGNYDFLGRRYSLSLTYDFGGR